MANSSLKALMYLSFIASGSVFIRLFKSRFHHYVFLFCCLIAVLLLMFWSLNFLPEDSGNYFRIFAYGNGVNIISEYPIFGGGPYDVSGLVGVNEINLLARGSTESAFLHLGAFYGVLPMFISFYWFKVLIKYKHNELLSSQSRTAHIEYVLCLFLLFDLFVGSFLGSTLALATLGYVLLATDKGTFDSR
tara:strand:+ start:39 stop:608 length:570 start_codon:yes stop_codon:yes gene_type:complete